MATKLVLSIEATGTFDTSKNALHQHTSNASITILGGVEKSPLNSDMIHV